MVGGDERRVARPKRFELLTRRFVVELTIAIRWISPSWMQGYQRDVRLQIRWGALVGRAGIGRPFRWLLAAACAVSFTTRGVGPIRRRAYIRMGRTLRGAGNRGTVIEPGAESCLYCRFKSHNSLISLSDDPSLKERQKTIATRGGRAWPCVGLMGLRRRSTITVEHPFRTEIPLKTVKEPAANVANNSSKCLI